MKGTQASIPATVEMKSLGMRMVRVRVSGSAPRARAARMEPYFDPEVDFLVASVARSAIALAGFLSNIFLHFLQQSLISCPL